MKVDLSGMCILLSGASGGIGRAIARHLALAGASIALHYNENYKAAKSLLSELGDTSRAIQADLSKKEGCKSLVEKTLKALGRIDVLINNAGTAIYSPLDKPLEEWINDWNVTIYVNLTAAGILSREAIKHFIKIGGGRIINIASRAAFRGDAPEYLAYAASKGGLVALSRSIARGFGRYNIKSFVIAPGYTRTDMAQKFIDIYGEGVASDDIALDRLTEPEDIAPIVVFLASGLADHATGCTIDVNAGSYVH